MPMYHYQAITRSGETEEGEMHAGTSAIVIKRLQDRGYLPLKAEEAAESPHLAARNTRWFWRRRKAGRAEVLLLTRNLASLLNAGTALDRAFDIMVTTEENPLLIDIMATIQTRLRAGASLSTAMASIEHLFSNFYISIVQAAEEGGNLSDGLDRLVTYVEDKDEIRSRVVSALIYPAILVCVAGMSMIVLLGWVVPRLQSMFDEMGAALPLATRVVLALSTAITHYGWLIFILIVLLVIVAQKVFSIPQHRYRLDRLLARLPLLGPLVCSFETTHFCRSLGTLMQNGVPLARALPIARGSLNNLAMRSVVSRAEAQIREGQRLGQAMAKNRLFPALAIQLIRVGEETGRLDLMLLKISQIYDKQVSLTMQRLLAFLEPVLIVALGLGIATIIISILAGIISVNQLPM